MMNRYLKKTKGAISLFLVIIMLSMITISGVLVDGSRIRTAETIYRGATSSAAVSALANYDYDLNKVYGMFAISQKAGDEDAIKSQLNTAYSDFLNQTLLISKDEEKYTDKIYSAIEGFILPYEFNNKSFFDIYGFQGEGIEVEPIYNLSEYQILKNQIVEHMKYRAPIELIENNFNMDEVIEKLEQATEESEVIGKRIELVEKMAKIENKLHELKTLSDELDSYTESRNFPGELGVFKEYKELLAKLLIEESALESKKKVTEHRNKDVEAEEAALLSSFSSTEDEIDLAEIDLQLKRIQDDRKKLQDELKVVESNHQGKTMIAKQDFEQSKDLVKDILRARKNEAEEANRLFNGIKSSLLQKLIDEMEDLLGEAKQKKSYLKKDSQNKSASEAIEKAIEDTNVDLDLYKELLEKMPIYQEVYPKVKENHTGFFSYALGEQALANDFYVRERVELFEFKNGHYVLRDEDEILEDINNIVDDEVTNNYTYTEIQFEYDLSRYGTSSEQMDDPREKVDKTAAKNQMKEDPEGKELPDGLPSGKDGVKKTKDYTAEDSEFLKGLVSTISSSNEDTSSSEYNEGVNQKAQEIIDDMDFSPEKKGFFEGIIEKIFGDDDEKTYASKSLGVVGDLFGSMLSETAESIRDSAYINTYITCTFKTRLTNKMPIDSGYDYSKKDTFSVESRKEAEKTLRFEDKKDLKTMLQSEVEYIIKGNKIEDKNKNAIYRDLLLLRTAINFSYLYTDKTSNQLALKAAVIIATSIGVPNIAPFIQLVIISAWATAESCLEMNHLLNGYRIPLLKNDKTFQLKLDNLGQSFDKPSVASAGDTSIWLKYEDFLTVYLYTVNQKTKLLRIADLIQVNMRENGHTTFAMENAFTYIRIDSKASIKYLFMTEPFMPKKMKAVGSQRPLIRCVFYRGY